jgi:hypothetical protein
LNTARSTGISYKTRIRHLYWPHAQVHMRLPEISRNASTGHTRTHTLLTHTAPLPQGKSPQRGARNSAQPGLEPTSGCSYTWGANHPSYARSSLGPFLNVGFFSIPLFFLQKMNWILWNFYTICMKFLHFKETLNRNGNHVDFCIGSTFVKPQFDDIIQIGSTWEVSGLLVVRVFGRGWPPLHESHCLWVSQTLVHRQETRTDLHDEHI